MVLREVGPLAAAMVVILRTGTAMSAELAMMRITGQTDALRRMGIESYDYLVVPRVAGVMVATAALTCYIQFLAVAGGMILSPFVIQASFTELYTAVLRPGGAGRFRLLDPQEPDVRLRHRR